MLEEPSGECRSRSSMMSMQGRYVSELNIFAASSATTLADRLDVDFALINRNRSKGDAPDSEGRMEILVGDVKNKVAILIDDMCDTGSTIRLATQTLINSGAKAVYAVVSHGKVAC